MPEETGCWARRLLGSSDRRGKGGVWRIGSVVIRGLWRCSLFDTVIDGVIRNSVVKVRRENTNQTDRVGFLAWSLRYQRLRMFMIT